MDVEHSVTLSFEFGRFGGVVDGLGDGVGGLAGGVYGAVHDAAVICRSLSDL